MRASDRTRAAPGLARAARVLVLGATVGGVLLPCAAAPPAASAPPARASAAASAPKANAGAASAPPKANASAASAPPAATDAKSVRVTVLFVAKTAQAPQPAAGATVRLEGSEQSVTTNVAGVAEVFGAIDAKARLVVIVVNAAKCILPLKGGASVTVLVPRKGQGNCSFGT
jgi:hypothetical protein